MDIIITKRLTLRPPLEVDAEQIAHALNDVEVSRNLSDTPHPYDLSDAHEWIKWSKRQTFVYTIHRQKLAGVVRMRDGAEAPIIGFWLAKEFWGNRYMDEALKAVLTKAFGGGINKIACSVFADNEAAIAILKKNGFQITGEGRSFCPARGESYPTTKAILKNADFQNLNTNAQGKQGEKGEQNEQDEQAA